MSLADSWADLQDREVLGFAELLTIQEVKRMQLTPEQIKSIYQLGPDGICIYPGYADDGWDAEHLP